MSLDVKQLKSLLKGKRGTLKVTVMYSLDLEDAKMIVDANGAYWRGKELVIVASGCSMPVDSSTE